MNTAPTPLLFGPFELLAPLGGGMSIVHRARRLADDAELAVKVLRRERLLDGEARARFAREVRALQQLTHPAICPLLDAGEVDGMPYLCMPLLQGRTLAAALTAAREHSVPLAAELPGTPAAWPNWRASVALLATIAEALDFAHRRGFVHRDVKPANLWVDPDGAPRLLDFGLTRDRHDHYRDLTRTGQIVGTPTYLAPEQLDARFGAVDGRTDVYSLAAVLFECLTLSPPFHGRDRAELFAAILAGAPGDLRRRLADAPAALADLIAACLARHPAERPATAAHFANDLRRILAGGAPLTRRPAWWRRVAGWARQRPLPAAASAALVLSGTVTTLWLAQVDAAAAHQAQQRARLLAQDWEGRLLVARSRFAQLPPPWPQHAATLAGWLLQHGQPLRDAAAGEAAAVPGLTTFVARAVPAVEARLAFARSPRAATATTFHDLWTDTLRQLAADPRWQGLPLVAQPGLVPIGVDPQSNLPEFYDLVSAAPELALPRRDEHGRLQLADRAGIVFVLVPGDAARGLLPFLFGKHELTRAQHATLDHGHDPTTMPLGVWNGELQTLRHPADGLRYFETLALLRSAGLDLPSDAMWLRAATLGHPDGWPVAGNFAGDADGYRRAAPVGTFAADACGLHDMLGNHDEWCLTSHDRPGDDPQRLPCTVRGGTYGAPPWALDGAATAEAGQPISGRGARAVRPWYTP